MASYWIQRCIDQSWEDWASYFELADAKVALKEYRRKYPYRWRIVNTSGERVEEE